MKFKETKAFADAIDYEHLLSVQDVTWSRNDESIYWVDDHNSVYSSHMTEGSTIQEDMFLCNADTECGYWVTHIFPTNMEMIFEEFECFYGEYF